MIDLSSNENPYAPSPLVIEALSGSMVMLNRYVDFRELDPLKLILAEYAQVPEKRIFVAHGTDAILQEILFAFAKGRDLITFNPSFLTGVEKGKSIAGKVLKIQLTPPDFKLQLNRYAARESLFILDSPNSPTGRCLIGEEDLVSLLEDSGHLVVIDEAYFEYSKKSFVELVATHPNLAIIRTLDKAFALAGLKISYLIAGDTFIKGLTNFASRINRPACAAGIAALTDQAYMTEHVQRLIEERDRLKDMLLSKGLEVGESETNFFLVKTSIPDFASKLLENNIMINNLSSTWLPGYYTISVGTRKENDLMLNAW